MPSCRASWSGPAEEALAGLWASAASLPTPAEVDAPGLWLARTEFLS